MQAEWKMHYAWPHLSTSLALGEHPSHQYPNERTQALVPCDRRPPVATPQLPSISTEHHAPGYCGHHALCAGRPVWIPVNHSLLSVDIICGLLSSKHRHSCTFPSAIHYWHRTVLACGVDWRAIGLKTTVSGPGALWPKPSTLLAGCGHYHL